MGYEVHGLIRRSSAAVNHAYYAIFGLTTALLLTEKIEGSKHAGVESAFIQHFIKPVTFENEYGRKFDYIRKKREESDYSARITIDNETAKKVVDYAEKFTPRSEEFVVSLLHKVTGTSKIIEPIDPRSSVFCLIEIVASPWSPVGD